VRDHRVIGIIDYGVGNLRSVQKAFEFVGASAEIVSQPEEINRCTHVVLPGVGAFGDGMRELETRGLIPAIQTAIHSGKPFLGICLGMQLLFESSSERGIHAGLAILPGIVKRFALPSEFKIPHMGWNQGLLKNDSPLIDPSAPPTHYYFVHSYYVCPTVPAMVVLECDYGGRFCAMVSHQNVHATQFHPEKSQTAGLAIVRAFSKLT
jgi:imidazole glycerol-phosphate synthase subunit HisH